MSPRSLLRAAAACAAVASAVLAPSRAAAQALTFDLASSFDTFNTPSSPFVAGYYYNYGDAVTPYTDRGVVTYNDGQALRALNATEQFVPGVYLAGPAGVDDPSFTPVFGANTLGMHPGANGEISVIRFFAPFAGTYAFSMFNQGLDRTDNTTTEANLVFYLAGGPSLYGGTVYGYGAPSSQTTLAVYDLTQGEFVDFALTDGGDGYAYDMTQFDVQIEARPDVTTTPEPASAALVGAGVLALGGAARRRA